MAIKMAIKMAKNFHYVTTTTAPTTPIHYDSTATASFASGSCTSSSGNMGSFATVDNEYNGLTYKIPETHPFDDSSFEQPSFKTKKPYSSFILNNNVLSVHVEINHDPMSFEKIILIKYSLNNKLYQFNRKYSELEFKKVDRMHIHELIVNDISEKIANKTKIKLIEALAGEESKAKGAFFYE